MGLLDSIKGFLNPMVISGFNDLFDNHYDALKYSCAAKDLSKDIPFNKKKEIVAKREAILKAYQQHLVRIEQERKKKAVVAAAAKYPHGFVIICDRYIGGVLGETVKRMPGTRKSLHELQQYFDRNKSKSSILAINLEDYFSGNRRVYDKQYKHFSYKSANYKDSSSIDIFTFGDKEDKFKYVDKIEDLHSTEIDKLYAHLDELPQEENSVLKKLKEEDIRIDFEDNVLYNLENPQRAKYYKAFINSIGDVENVKDYCVKHLSELDNYIRDTIHTEYERIKKTYSLGVTYYRRNITGTRREIEEEIVENEERIASLNSTYKKYCALKRKYPIGLPAYEKYNTYDDGKNSGELSIEEIVEREEEIYLFERYADKYSSFISWQNEQRDFASISRNLNPKDFGCYFYDIPLKGVKPDGTETAGDYRVWQHFYTSFFDTVPEVTIDDDFAYLTERADENSKFLTGGWNYRTSVYDKIWDLIIAFKEKVGDISIVFASNGLDSNQSFLFNINKFNYLIDKIENSNIPYYEGEGGLCPDVKLTKHILIIEFISKNTRLKETVEFVRNKYASTQPLISYISIRKGYDLTEVENLEAQKRKEKQEQKAKEEAEKKRIQQEKERKAAQKRELDNCVSNWNCIGNNLHYNYLLRYYPTTCDFDATEDEWADRWLVWNFKNTPGKTSSIQHEQALNNLLPRLTRMLKTTFDDKLNLLTLVCIPAASKVNNNARFKDFSERLSNNTGMDNAFEHIQVVEDATPKHLGGTGTPVLHFDENFFKGRYILLFDDVITKGHSMLRFKLKLEALGATVIAGVSVGKTTHER